MKIYIDPGHNFSGADTGARGNGLIEQDITYFVAKRLRQKLEEAGLKVRMSRNNVTDNVGSGTVQSSLADRSEDANRWGADLFVSLHCNAGGGTGVETYCAQGGISTGYKLAKKIQTRLAELTGLVSRGVKINPSLAVIKRTDMPAVLVEMGFIDNASDSEILGSENGQERITEGIAQGICDHLLIDYEGGITMSQYAELKSMILELTETVKQLAVEVAEIKDKPIYNYIDKNMPEWARPTIQKLAEKGILKGDENGLNLTEELMRILVIIDRSGTFGE